MSFNLPPPDLQVSFALKLTEARGQILQEALKSTVKSLDIEELDKQLAKCAPKAGLSLLAAHGLRGELVFPAPVVLESKPRLLAYYRLLFGYSQKLFYTAATGLGRFRSMEERGIIASKSAQELWPMCMHLGGRDFSNIHNRVGEAEKSHQKARAAGFTECWTIVNVDRTDLEKAKRESPTTNRFFRLSDLLDQGTAAYRDFHDRIQALTGIASSR